MYVRKLKEFKEARNDVSEDSIDIEKVKKLFNERINRKIQLT